MPDSISVAFTATPTGAAVKLAIYATRPLSAGINFQQRGAYKLIKVTSVAAASPIDISTEYAAIFGAITPGQKVLFYVVPIDNTSGIAGVPFQTSAIVA